MVCTYAVYVDDTSVYFAHESKRVAAHEVSRTIDFIVDRLEIQGLKVSGPVAGQSKSIAIGSTLTMARMLASMSRTKKLVIKSATKNLGAPAGGAPASGLVPL